MPKRKPTPVATAFFACAVLMLIGGSAAGTDIAESTDRSPNRQHPGSRQIIGSSGATLKVEPVPRSGTAATWRPLNPMPGARSVLLEENFESLPHEGEIPSGWQTHDRDGDSYTWEPTGVGPYEGDNCVIAPVGYPSGSDNWLVTPLISVPPGGRQFQFYARHSLFEQAFEVWETETGQSPTDFTLFGELLAEDTTSGSSYELYSYWVNLGGFHSKDVYLAIRHVSEDGFVMVVDAVTLPNSESEFIGFEGPPEFPPPGWADIIVWGIGIEHWGLSDGTGTQPPGVVPHSGQYMAQYDCWNAFQPMDSRMLRSPELDFSGYENQYTLTFWMYHDDGLPGYIDNLKFSVSTNGTYWQVWETIYRYSPSSHWQEYSFDLSSYAGENSVWIGLIGESYGGNGIYLDDITVTRNVGEQPCVLDKVAGDPSSYITTCEAGMGFFTYFDPVEECGAPYPFSLSLLSFSLLDPGEGNWPVAVDIVVYEPTDFWVACDGPGEELYRYSAVLTEENFGYPEFGLYEFPEPCCLSSPVYLGFEYTAGVSGATPGIVLDDNLDPDTCDHWGYFAGEPDPFIEWYDWMGGFFGSPILIGYGTEKSPDCEVSVFHFETGLLPYPYPDSNVAWHQVWSENEYCTSWHQDRIGGDTAGVLSPGDTVCLSLLPDRVTAKEVLVQKVRHMLEVDDDYSPDTLFVEYCDPANEAAYWSYPLPYPGRYWSAVWPYDMHSELYVTIDVNDANGNSALDEGDHVYFLDKAGGNLSGAVIDVYTSIVVQELGAQYVCGDADDNDIVNISDAVYLISYIFGGGPEPIPLLAGDCDCNGIVNISDAVYLIAYIFGGGPEPCAGC